MTRVTVDAQMRITLRDFIEPLDLCDESGRLVGRFLPVSTAPPPGYLEPPLSEEEWTRRRQEPGYPLREVMARLERL